MKATFFTLVLLLCSGVSAKNSGSVDSLLLTLQNEYLGYSCILDMRGNDNDVLIDVQCGGKDIDSISLKLEDNKHFTAFGRIIETLSSKSYSNTSCVAVNDTQSFLGTGLSRFWYNTCVFQKL